MKRSALALLLLVVLTACSGGSSKGISPPGPSGQKGSGASAAQIKLADLPPCPASSGASVNGGLPDLTLQCLGNGPAVNLAGLTGKPMVLNLWASWCTDCQAEEGRLSSVYNADKARVRFLGVDTEETSLDSALNLDANVTPPVRYPSVLDPDRKLLIDLHFVGLPSTVLVSSSGEIVYRHPGVYISAGQLRSDLAKYLHVT